jgi:hypothetical protein
MNLIKRNTRPNAKRPGPPRRGRVIDRDYMDWIRTLQCVVCAQQVIGYWFGVQRSSRTEAAHVGQRGIGQKSSDRETIPLCAEHHRLGKDSVHRLGKNFWQHHGIDRYALIRELQARYEKEREAA